MRIASLVLAASVLSLVPAALPAQPPPQAQDRMARPQEDARPGELILYSNNGYNGRTYYVTGPRTHIDPPFPPMSIKVAPNERWRVCSNYEYRDPCVVVAANVWSGLMGLRQIRSAQPMRGGGGGGGGRPDFTGTGNPGPVLKGMASEYFRSPQDRGRRVVACPGRSAAAACAKETADRYCRAWGYAGGAAYQLLETVGREVYLADVLCKRAM